MECMCAAFSKLTILSIQLGWDELAKWLDVHLPVCLLASLYALYVYVYVYVWLLSSFDKLNYNTQSGIKIPWLQHLFDDMFDILARTINFRFHFIRMHFDIKLNL